MKLIAYEMVFFWRAGKVYFWRFISLLGIGLYFIGFINIFIELLDSMRQRPFVVHTSSGQIQLTKGSYLTLSRRLKQHPCKCINKKKVRIVKQSKKCMGLLQAESISKRTRIARNQKGIRNQYFGQKQSLETEEDSTWSNINFAVYSLSLQLSAANYDHHYTQYT